MTPPEPGPHSDLQVTVSEWHVDQTVPRRQAKSVQRLASSYFLWLRAQIAASSGIIAMLAVWSALDLFGWPSFLLFLPILLLLASLRPKGPRSADREISDIMAFPSQVRQFPIDVIYYREEIAYGGDSGFASFVDGWMHFEGIQSGFSLGRAVAKPLTPDWLGHIVGKRRAWTMRLFGGVQSQVAFQTPNGPGSVRLLPRASIKIGDHIERGLDKEFLAALVDWEDAPARAGSNVLPPQSVHPDYENGLGSLLPFTAPKDYGMVVFILYMLSSGGLWMYFAVLVLSLFGFVAEHRRQDSAIRAKFGLSALPSGNAAKPLVLDG